MGTYRFYDASGDSYKLGVWLGIGASHYIYFNSRDPRIVKVTFESSDDDKVGASHFTFFSFICFALSLGEGRNCV